METDSKLGRPKKYVTASDLGDAIDSYFSSCDERRYMRSKDLADTIPYTVEGLCRAIGVDRRTLLTYENDADDAERCEIVKSAKLRIQQDVVERGLSGRSNPVVSIFNLKNNFGYVDKTETDTVVKIDPVAQSALNGLSLEQLEAIEKIIQQK